MEVLLPYIGLLVIFAWWIAFVYLLPITGAVAAAMYIMDTAGIGGYILTPSGAGVLFLSTIAIWIVELRSWANNDRRLFDAKKK